MELLEKNDFSVLRYSLFGRGYSDRPKHVRYNAETYRKQLHELLAALEIDEPILLVGNSLGGAVSADYSAHYPESIDKLLLLSPASYFEKLPTSAKLIQTPLIGDYLAGTFGTFLVNRNLKTNFHDPQKHKTDIAELRQSNKTQYRFFGYKRALKRTIRNYEFLSLMDKYCLVGQAEIPTTILWGEKDELTPFSGMEKVKECIPNAQIESIPNTEHFPIYEHPEITKEYILDFIAMD